NSKRRARVGCLGTDESTVLRGIKKLEAKASASCSAWRPKHSPCLWSTRCPSSWAASKRLLSKDFIVFRKTKGFSSIQKEKASTSLQFSDSEKTLIPLDSNRWTMFFIDRSPSFQ